MNTKHMIPEHFGAFGVDSTGASLGRVGPLKVFARPFRLAFAKPESNTVVWLEVRSLTGLRSVAEKLDSGELKEIDRYSSLEMQLWGLLAEHSGFLKIQGSASMLSAGLQPLGEETAALTDDLASLMGGSDADALSILGAMRDTLKGKPIDKTPMEQVQVTHEFVKSDGVNLTEAGEDALRDLVLGATSSSLGEKQAPRKETLAFEKACENAIQIFCETETPKPDVDGEMRALLLEQGQIEPKVITGTDAAQVGRRIEQAREAVDEQTLATLVGQSEMEEEEDPESLAALQKFTEDLKGKLRGTIDQTDAYTQKDVTPACPVPRDQDERAKWLAETESRGYDMREMRRLSGLDKPDDTAERIKRSLDVSPDNEDEDPSDKP